MNAENFPEANDVLKAPPGVPGDRCYDLPIHRYTSPDGHGPGGIVSCWRPTKEDIKRIALGEPIYLHVEGKTHPPLLLTTENLFLPMEPTPSGLAEIDAGASACSNCLHFKKAQSDPREGVCMRLMRTTVHHHVCDDHQGA